MLDRWFNYPAHYYLHFVGLLILSFGLPLNKVVMSIGTIWLVSNLFLEFQFKTYFKNIVSNKITIVICCIFLIHLIGLLWTDNYSYAFSDIRIKLPFFLIPLTICAKPIKENHKQIIIYIFCAVLLITSIVNVYHFNSNDHFTDGTDIRLISLFGSHIRYGLLVIMGICISLSQITRYQKKSWMWVLTTIWFFFYLIISQVLSSYIVLVILFIGLPIYFIHTSRSKTFRVINLIFITASALLMLFILKFLFITPEPRIIYNELEKESALGNPYLHDTTLPIQENGSFIFTYIQEDELRLGWKQKSKISIDGLDNKGQNIKGTLIRYLTSKGLKKDLNGVNQLDQDDIYNIENGISSIRQINSPFLARIDGLKYQIQYYKYSDNLSGHSLLQRLEHWRAAMLLIKENFIIGVGTGDIEDEFQKTYEHMNSPLTKETRKRAHNQYLTFWISFGFIGFALIVLLSWFLISTSFKNKSFIAFCFSLILIASFIPEDTLETQQGVTFVGFFIAIFFSGKITNTIEIEKHP